MTTQAQTTRTLQSILTTREELIDYIREQSANRFESAMQPIDRWELFLDFRSLCESSGMPHSEMVKHCHALERDLWDSESLEIDGLWSDCALDSGEGWWTL